MPQLRVAYIVGMLLLLIGGMAYASGEPARAVVAANQPAPSKAKKAQPAAPKAKKLARRVVALPSEIAGLLFANGLTSPAFGWKPVSVVWAADSQAAWDLKSGLLLNAQAAQETLQLNLSENRVALWLRDDLNLHCDLEQDRTIARGDQFAVKLGLQFRFR